MCTMNCLIWACVALQILLPRNNRQCSCRQKLTWYVGDNADNSGKSLTVTVTPANVDYSLNTLSNFNVTKSEDGKTLTITPNNDAVNEGKIVDVDDEDLVLTTTDGKTTATVTLQIIEKPASTTVNLKIYYYWGNNKTQISDNLSITVNGDDTITASLGDYSSTDGWPLTITNAISTTNATITFNYYNGWYTKEVNIKDLLSESSPQEIILESPY